MTFALLSACGGFLIAVLWMDLMFDAQTLRHREGVLPEEVIDSLAAYYRRVTTEAAPMERLITAVMVVAALTALVQVVTAPVPFVGVVSLALAGGAIALAQLRILPAAVRLAAQQDTPETQTRLAREICRDHLIALTVMIAFTALQLLSVA
jgi:hypothetical protein